MAFSLFQEATHPPIPVRCPKDDQRNFHRSLCRLWESLSIKSVLWASRIKGTICRIFVKKYRKLRLRLRLNPTDLTTDSKWIVLWNANRDFKLRYPLSSLFKLLHLQETIVFPAGKKPVPERGPEVPVTINLRHNPIIFLHPVLGWSPEMSFTLWSKEV